MANSRSEANFDKKVLDNHDFNFDIPKRISDEELCSWLNMYGGNLREFSNPVNEIDKKSTEKIIIDLTDEKDEKNEKDNITEKIISSSQSKLASSQSCTEKLNRTHYKKTLDDSIIDPIQNNPLFSQKKRTYSSTQVQSNTTDEKPTKKYQHTQNISSLPYGRFFNYSPHANKGTVHNKSFDELTLEEISSRLCRIFQPNSPYNHVNPIQHCFGISQQEFNQKMSQLPGQPCAMSFHLGYLYMRIDKHDRHLTIDKYLEKMNTKDSAIAYSSFHK